MTGAPKTLVFTIAPLGDVWGLWLNGDLIEEPPDREEAEWSAETRLTGARERGDYGRLILAEGPPPPKTPRSA